MTPSANQWPVYQVFERPGLGRPMRAAGSVHAVDPETALQNAWAVYGRRPTAVALWAVPRDVVLMKTKEQLNGSSPRTAPRPDDRLGGEEQYCVFRQCGSRITYDEAAPVQAATAEQAIALAAGQLESEDCHAW